MKRAGNLLSLKLLTLFNSLFIMSYSFFIWGSEPRADGTFYPWEIYNVLPDIEPGKKCPQHLAQLMLRDAMEENPGFQFAMTDCPQVPDILSGQCSSLF